MIDVIGDWVKDLPPDSAPGEKWAYSNWGYMLLGAIIEQASGQRYAEFLQQAFFDPLGMRHTFYADRRRVIPGRATGYDQPPDGPLNSASRSRNRCRSGRLSALSRGSSGPIEAAMWAPAPWRSRVTRSWRRSLAWAR